MRADGLSLVAIAFAVVFAVALASAGASSPQAALLALGGVAGAIGLGAIARFAPRRACDSLLVAFVALVAIPIDAYLGYRAHTGGWPGIRVSVADVFLYLLVPLALLGALAGRVENAAPRNVLVFMGLLLAQYALAATFAADRVLSVYEIAGTVHAFLIAVLVASLLRRDLLSWILALVALQVLVHTGFAVAQAATGRPIGAGWLGGNAELLTEVLVGGAARLRPAGLFTHPIVYAMSLVITLPLLVAGAVVARSLWLRTLFAGTVAFGAVGLLLTLSRGAWISAVVAIAAMGVLALRCRLMGASQIRRLAVALFVGFLVTAAVFGPRVYERMTRSDEGNLEVRLDLNAIALRMIADNPLFGVGLNNFVATMEPYDPKDVMAYFAAPAHNLYLLESAEAGIPALVLWLGLFAAILRTGVRGIVRMRDPRLQWIGLSLVAGLVGFLVSQLADFSHRLEPLRSMVWMNVGLLLGVLHVGLRSGEDPAP